MNPKSLLSHGLCRPARLGLIVAVLLAGCAAGGGLHSEGMRLVADGQRDAGLAQLREAARIDPTNAQFRIDLLREELMYTRELLERGDEARRAGKADVAQEHYQHVLKLTPGNERAARGLSVLQMDARHANLLADAERALKEGNLEVARAAVKTVLTENPANENANRVSALLVEQQAKVDQAKAAQDKALSILRKPVTLQFRDANLRMVFEALSRTTGLNVILDRDVRADLKTTIFVKDASVEDTVDLILLQNQLDKRTLNASTLFVYPATAAKQKEYQDLQVRTFQVANADAKYLQTVLKSLLKVKDSSVDERTNTIIVRDTPEAVAVAAKIIAASDVPEAEVMLEVEVLEISRTRAQNIGLQLPTSFQVATPSGATTLGALKALTRNDLTASGLSATLNLQLQDSDNNLLASPRIRARNKEKAKILIGDRVPTVTNSVTPAGTGSVVTGSVQYQEVGLKLEFEPQIYNSQEVGIKLSLEVSNIVDTFTDQNGSRSYQIGTRSAQTSLRLRDGETQVLGGLISDQDRNTASKIPGLGHLPKVGALFGNNDDKHTKTEIVLSITPRIIRAPANVEAALRDIFSGTESSIRERALRLDPVGDFRGATRASGAAAAPAAAPAPAPAPAVPRTPPAPAAPGAAPEPADAAPTSSSAAPDAAPPVALNATPTAAAPAQAPNAIASPSLQTPRFAPRAAAAAAPAATPSGGSGGSGDISISGPASTRVGESFTVSLNASAMPPLRNMPMSFRFDPAVLRFESAALGSLAQSAGAAAPAPTVDTRTGRIDLPLNFSNPEGLSGDGAVVELTFTVHTGRATTQVIAAQGEAGGTDGSSRIPLPGPRSLSLRILQ
jgi:general secretion pathway protein D